MWLSMNTVNRNTVLIDKLIFSFSVRLIIVNKKAIERDTAGILYRTRNSSHLKIGLVRAFHCNKLLK